MTQLPPTANFVTPSPSVRPNRGVAVLVLGILSLVTTCFIFGIIAWVMGNTDLREMEAGRMDRSGLGITKAGKICGMISVFVYAGMTVLWIVVIIIFAIFGSSSVGEMFYPLS